MRFAVSEENAAGVRAVGRWKVEGKSEWKGDSPRTVATIPDEVSVHIDRKPLIR